MNKPELKLSAPGGGTTPLPDITGTVETERGRKPPAGSVDNKRAALHAETHAQNAANQEADALATAGLDSIQDDGPKPREDIETIEVDLLDGRHVVFGPPPGVSLTMRTSMVLGDRQTEALHSIARVCMSVRTIDGKPLLPIGNMVDLQRTANIIGDQGLDILGFLLSEHWPPIKIGELAGIKKNLRQP